MNLYTVNTNAQITHGDRIEFSGRGACVINEYLQRYTYRIVPVTITQRDLTCMLIALTNVHIWNHIPSVAYAVRTIAALLHSGAPVCAW